MTSTPAVSVIITCFNYGRFLAEAVRSVTQQSYPKERLEILVVDDGSTDETPQVMERLGTAVRGLRQTHQGQGAAFSLALEHAQGELIAFLDADDLWHPDRVARVVEVCGHVPEAGLVQHRMLDTEDAHMSAPLSIPKRDTHVQTPSDFLAGHIRFTGTSGLSFRRATLDRIGPIPAGLFFCADEFLYHRAAMMEPVATLPYVLGRRRVHGNNWYAGRWSADRLAQRMAVRDILDHAFDEGLHAHGLAVEPGAREHFYFDSRRERLLLAAMTQNRALVHQTWGELQSLRPGGLPLRRRMTLALARVAPRVYMTLYDRLFTPLMKFWRLRSHES